MAIDWKLALPATTLWYQMFKSMSSIFATCTWKVTVFALFFLMYLGKILPGIKQILVFIKIISYKVKISERHQNA